MWNHVQGRTHATDMHVKSTSARLAEDEELQRQTLAKYYNEKCHHSLSVLATWAVRVECTYRCGDVGIGLQGPSSESIA